MFKIGTIAVITTISLMSCSYGVKIEKYVETKSIENENKKIVEEIKKDSDIKQIIEIKENEIENEVKLKNKSIPNSFYIQANFICQAPLETEANWKYHEESCEEAALLQTINYEKNISMTKMQAHEEILNMISWQNQNMGGHHDIYADKIKELAMAFYGLKDKEVIIIYDASIEDIKRIISEGHPVMAPVTSKYLKNPNYQHPGYHMLQVIGYNENKIITNDNGTRKGKDYPYSIEVFERALIDAGADIIYLEIE